MYHLASRKCSLQDLLGIPDLLDKAGLMESHKPRRRARWHRHAPGQPWKHGKHTINTLWGELAWQLGGRRGVRAREGCRQRTARRPVRTCCRSCLEQHAPCVLLIDELVAYIRQFAESKRLSGGTYDSNLSFVQSLTEAVKLVPNAVVLASLPESEVEAGSQRGVAALRALEKIFGRVQALWKPVATEEAFEIVRRRLFEPDMRDAKSPRSVCRAFADAYVAEGAKLPTETQEVALLRAPAARLSDPSRSLRPAL